MNKTLLWVIVAVVVLGGGYYLLKGNSMYNQPSTTPAQVQPTTASVTEAVTSTTKAMAETAVTLTAKGFEPQKVTVKVGTKVVWMNKSGEMANVSSAVHPTHLVYPPLNLENFDDGTSVSLVFDKSGTYKYHDHLNPSRFGTVVVEE